MSENIVISLIGIIPAILTFFLVLNQGRKIESVKKTGEANHALGNSAKGAQLKLTALALDAAATYADRIADGADAQRGDKDAAVAAWIAAKEAHKLFEEHESKQADLDAQSNMEAL